MELGLFRKSLEDAQVMERDGYSYFIHPLTDSIPPLKPELVAEVAKAIIESTDLDVDYIVTMEAMGIHMTAVIAQLTGTPYNIIRKRSYGLEKEIEISQKTCYSKNKMYLNSVNEGDIVMIVDAVISTGNTLVAVIEALKERGAIIKDIMCAIERDNGVEEVKKHTGFNVKSLARIEVGDRVKIVRKDR